MCPAGWHCPGDAQRFSNKDNSQKNPQVFFTPVPRRAHVCDWSLLNATKHTETGAPAKPDPAPAPAAAERSPVYLTRRQPSLAFVARPRLGESYPD